MDAFNRSARRRTGSGLAFGIGLGLLAVTGLAFASSGGSSGRPGAGPLIPSGPLTDAERMAAEKVLALNPPPDSYPDGAGRVWTPCADWWLGVGIPDWPAGVWPGQVPYLRKPIDLADWFACIAGYLVYAAPLAKAATETFNNEPATVDITRRLSERRDVIRSYILGRLAALGRANSAIVCKDPAPPPIAPAPQAPQQPPPGSLPFDLESNWGGLPMVLREQLARIELAARIPGLARALGVKWWQAWRAKKPLVTPAEAAALAAANPDLCRLCLNKGDAGASAKILDAAIWQQGWPAPKDLAGWKAGSYGLGDMLGGVAVYTGIHTDPGGLADFLQAPDAAKFIRQWWASGMASAYSVRRILLSPDYSVLIGGVNSDNGDSFQTWANVFTAYAYPAAYKAGSQLAVDTKARFIARAQEIGIDLGKIAYPWPPGTTYKAPAWTAGQVWQTLKSYKDRPVFNIGA